MNLLIVSDSFKGTFSSVDVSRFLKEGVIDKDASARVRIIPASDGGEGFLDALTASKSFDRYSHDASDLLRRACRSVFLRDGKTAYIEAALTCGLANLAENEKNPLKTTTFGLGSQILAAEESGCDKFVIGLGGTGTHDCGIGALQALGARFFDGNGALIPEGAGGAELLRIARADFSNVPTKIGEASFVLAADVKNPLTGANGAARVFSPQKGADAETAAMLEEGSLRFAAAVKEAVGKDLLSLSGGGAAGGLGAGLSIFNGTRIVSGADVVLENARFDELLCAGIDGVITGEGCADLQTSFGKLPVKAALAARKRGVPVCLVCGRAGAGCEKLCDFGVSRVMALFKEPLPHAVLMRDTPAALRAAGRSVAEFFKSRARRFFVC